MSASESHSGRGDLHRSVASTFLSQVAFAIFAFCASVIAARGLGVADRGVLAVLVLVPFLFSLVLDLGQRAVSSSVAAELPAIRAQLHANYVVYAALAVVPSGLVCAALYHVLEAGDSHLALTASIGGIATGANVYVNAASGLALGSGRVGLYNLSRIANGVGYLVGVAVLYGAGQDSPRVFFEAWTGSYLLVVAIFLGSLKITQLPSARIARLQLQRGIPVYFTNLGNLALLRMDQLVLAALASKSAVGAYTVSVNMAEILWYLPEAVGLIALPYLAGVRSDHDKRAALIQSLRIGWWGSIAAGAVLGTAAPWLIPFLFGPSFSSAVLPFELLLLGVLAMSVYRIAFSALAARNEARLLIRLVLAAALTNITLNLLLVPIWSASGASVASTVAYTLLGVGGLRVLERVWGLPVLAGLLPERPIRMEHLT